MCVGLSFRRLFPFRGSAFVLAFTGLSVWFCPMLVSLAEPSATAETFTMPESADTSQQPSLSQNLSARSTFEEEDIVPNVVTLQAYLSKQANAPLSIGLANVVDWVVRQNLSVANAQLSADIARSLYGQSIGSLLPNVTFTYAQDRFQGGIQIFGGETITIYRTRYQPQVELNWTVHPAGRDVFLAQAQKRLWSAAKSGEQDTLQTQLSESVRAYFQLLEAALQLWVAQQTLDVADEQLRLDSARRQAGVAPKLDVMRSEALVAQRRQTLLVAETNYAKAEQTLLFLLNLDPQTPLAPVLEEAAIFRFIPEDYTAQGLLALARAQHPRLQQAAYQQASARSQYRAALVDLVPELNLTTYAALVGPDLNNLEPARFAGFVVQADLLQGLGVSTYYQIREGRQRMQQLQVQQQQTVRNIEQAVTQAWLDVREARQRIPLAETSLRASEEAFRLASGRFRTGLAIQLDVLTAEQELLEARQAVVTAVMNYNQAQVRLLEATGQLNVSSLTQGLPGDTASSPVPTGPAPSGLPSSSSPATPPTAMPAKGKMPSSSSP